MFYCHTTNKLYDASNPMSLSKAIGYCKRLNVAYEEEGLFHFPIQIME